MGFYDDLLDDVPTVPATSTGAAAGDVPHPDAEQASPAADTGTDPTADAAGDGKETGGVAANTEEQHDTTEIDAAEASPAGTDGADSGTVVPDAIASRPIVSGLRTRFHGHQAINDLVREDWIKAIKLNPDAFDAVLFRAASLSEVQIDDDGYEVMPAEKIDPNQETLAYADPELVVVVDCPDEMPNFYAMNDTDENTGAPDDALILCIAAHDVPIGSILEWMEDMASGEPVRRWWYVHRKFNYGTAAVGTLYYCIPSRSYEGMFDGTE